MKRFMLFAGPTYYAAGGPDDLVAVADSPDELSVENIDTLRWNGADDGWARLFDAEIGLVVAEWEYDGNWTLEEAELPRRPMRGDGKLSGDGYRPVAIPPELVDGAD